MTTTSPSGETLFGHPKGLYLLAFAELWERFSFFGMKALLVIYLTERWQLTDVAATSLYGAYTALTYGTSLLGGFVADRLLGLKRALLLGGTLIVAGNLGLALQDQLAGRSRAAEILFTLALSLIVTGTGLFKPSVATQVGALYTKDDEQREGGFYIFYVGINIGGVLAPLFCGFLSQNYGWTWGFLAAAGGMILGLGTVFRGRDWLSNTTAMRATPARSVLGGLVPLGGVACAYLLLRTPAAVGPVLVITLGSALAFLVRFMITVASADERRRMLGALSLIFAAVIFWSLSQQAGSSLNLFAARAVDLSVGPIALRSTQTQFFNPAFIVLLAPVFAFGWRWLAGHDLEPLAPFKFVLGLLLAGAGFTALALGSYLTPAGGHVALGWLVCAYFLQTSGELCLVTPGLATITQLAPKPVATLMMGLWLFALSAGNFLGALMAGMTMAAAAGSSDPHAYAPSFGHVALVAGIAAVALLAIKPLLNRLLWRGEALRSLRR